MTCRTFSELVPSSLLHQSAAMFEPHLKPSSRTMTGLPITGIRRGTSQYGSLGRKPAPEILSGTPLRIALFVLTSGSQENLQVDF